MRTTIAISAAALLLSPRLVAAAPMPASAYSGAGGSANGGSVTSDSSSGPAVDGLGFLPDALGVFSADGAGSSSSSSSSSTSSDGKLLSAKLLGNDVLGGDVLGHGKGLLGHDAVGDGLLGGHLLGLRVRDLSDSAYSGAGGQANGGSADTDRHDDLLRLLNIGSDNAGSGGDASSGMAGVFGRRLGLRQASTPGNAYSGVGGQANGGSVTGTGSTLKLLNIGSNNAGNGGQANSGNAIVGGSDIDGLAKSVDFGKTGSSVPAAIHTTSTPSGIAGLLDVLLGHGHGHDVALNRRKLFMPMPKHGSSTTLPHHAKLSMRQASGAYSGVGGSANGGNAGASHNLFEVLNIGSGNAGDGGHANSGDAKALGKRQNAYSGAGSLANGGQGPPSGGLLHALNLGSGNSGNGGQANSGDAIVGSSTSSNGNDGDLSGLGPLDGKKGTGHSGSLSSSEGSEPVSDSTPELAPAPAPEPAPSSGNDAAPPADEHKDGSTAPVDGSAAADTVPVHDDNGAVTAPVPVVDQGKASKIHHKAKPAHTVPRPHPIDKTVHSASVVNLPAPAPAPAATVPVPAPAAPVPVPAPAAPAPAAPAPAVPASAPASPASDIAPGAVKLGGHPHDGDAAAPVTSQVSNSASYSGAGGQALGGSVDKSGGLINLFSNNAGDGGAANSGASGVGSTANGVAGGAAYSGAGGQATGGSVSHAGGLINLFSNNAGNGGGAFSGGAHV